MGGPLDDDDDPPWIIKIHGGQDVEVIGVDIIQRAARSRSPIVSVHVRKGELDMGTLAHLTSAALDSDVELRITGVE